MSNITLYFAPGTCSRVAMISLEEAGAAFDTRLVAHLAGDHRSAPYLHLNPAGKVPALIADGKALSENVAILFYLSRRFPDAQLLPMSDDPFEIATVLSDLSFCASVLHPLVTRLRIPGKFCDQPDSDRNVWQLAAAEMRFHFDRIEARLSKTGPWWYGSHWSSMDAYIFWVWFRVTGAGFPAEPYPAFQDHANRIARRPATKKTLMREAKAEAELASRGLALEFKNIDF